MVLGWFFAGSQSCKIMSLTTVSSVIDIHSVMNDHDPWSLER